MRRRLHSVGFFWLRRVFAVLLVTDAGRVVRDQWFESQAAEAPLVAVFHAGAFLLVAYLLWSRGKSVFATEVGLELGSGKELRLIPWGRVTDLREMPWMSLHPPWYPKRYQLDLADGESLDFVGRRDARAIVSELSARSSVIA